MTIFVLVLRGGTHFQVVPHEFCQRGWVQDHFLHLFFFGNFFISIEIFQKKNLGYMNDQITSTLFIILFFICTKYPFYYLMYPFYYLIFYMYLDI